MILFSLLIMTDLVSLSDFLSIMALSCMEQLFECFLLTRCERFLKPWKAELVDSSEISRKIDVARFLYRNICTVGAFVSQRDQNTLHDLIQSLCYNPGTPPHFFYIVCPLLTPQEKSALT